MKRLTIFTLTMLALTGTMVTTALAQNPHFLSCSASGPDKSGDLLDCFRIAGLGSTPTEVTVSADVTAVYACRNHGDQCPNAANKQSVTSTQTATGTFTPRNGQVRGCLAVSPPPATLNCPGNQTAVLVSVSYSNVQVSAVGTSCSSSGTFSENFFPNCP